MQFFSHAEDGLDAASPHLFLLDKFIIPHIPDHVNSFLSETFLIPLESAVESLQPHFISTSTTVITPQSVFSISH